MFAQKYKYVDQVKEFKTTEELNSWLYDEKNYRKIKKVYRNAQNEYFVHYSAKLEIKGLGM